MSRTKGSKNRTPEELVERAEFLIRKATLQRKLEALKKAQQSKEGADDKELV